jgi:sulfate/thiosulfate-binding protein
MITQSARRPIAEFRAAVLIITSLIVAACAAGAPGQSSIGGATDPSGSAGASAANASSVDVESAPGAITLVAYSTPREAYEEIIPLFQATSVGNGVEFEQSYGPSGDQSRAVAAGLPGDYVGFSLWSDMQRLVDAGIVAEQWADDEHAGMISDSVVVLAVRKGNPKNIQGWDDLLRADVSVITPNPFTSGGAQWNVMAAYGAQTRAGKTQAEAVAFLSGLFHRVLVQDKSAREALQTFVSGQGDVMIAYENEAITAQRQGEELEYIVPDATILIENPAAVTLNGDATDKAKAFLDFVRSAEGQRIFGQKGYRPVDTTVLAEFDYPEPARLFTIKDLGGWADVRAKFFDREKGIMAEVERQVGVEP